MAEYVLYDYQNECLEAVDAARKAGKRAGLAVVASGLGKTVIAAHDAQRWLSGHGGKVLYLCHQNDILAQARDIFKNVLGEGRRFGFFNGFERNAHQVEILFASLQTMRKYLERFRPDEFGYIVFDESHHTPAETYTKVINYFTPRFLLGLTATPDRRDGLNIRSIYGDEVFYLPLEDALVRSLVTAVDYRLVGDEVLLAGIAERTDMALKEIDEIAFVPKADTEVAELIAQYAKGIENPRTIVFAQNITRADALARAIRGSVTIHSHVAAKERAVRLELFRLGLIPTVVAVDCLNEGIDVPQANLIVFLRSTSSHTIFIQQLGRGLRQCAGKEKVTVLDFVGNCERIMRLKELSDAVECRRRAYAERSREKGAEALPEEQKSVAIIFDEKIVQVLDMLKRLRPHRISDNPLLLEEYSPRNPIAASRLSEKTTRPVWWRCRQCGYEYRTSAMLRHVGDGCPQCKDRVTETNNLAFLHINLAAEFSYKNPVTAKQVRATAREIYLWCCRQCGYEYWTSPRARVHRGDKCPQCSALMSAYKDNMAFRLPHLQKEYSDMNTLAPSRFHWKSNKSVWWLCEKCAHTWEASVFARSVGRGECPPCTETVATPANNIVRTHPHFAEEYSSRNRTPVGEVCAQSGEMFFWVCSECGRYFKTSPKERVNGTQCPFCIRSITVAPSPKRRAPSPHGEGFCFFLTCFYFYASNLIGEVH